MPGSSTGSCGVRVTGHPGRVPADSESESPRRPVTALELHGPVGQDRRDRHDASESVQVLATESIRVTAAKLPAPTENLSLTCMPGPTRVQLDNAISTPPAADTSLLAFYLLIEVMKVHED
jgi:hypothetical protein